MPTLRLAFSRRPEPAVTRTDPTLIPETYDYAQLTTPVTGVHSSLDARHDNVRTLPTHDAHELATREAAARVRNELVCLDRLVNYFRAQNSTLGYFAAVYREMTASVWRCLSLEAGHRRVAQPTLMADFIHIFAGRYLDALRDPEHASECWKLAFQSGEAPVLFHLLTSMNAHIRLDLGLALAAATRHERTLQLFRKDFDIINKLVSGYDPTHRLLGLHTPQGVVNSVADVLRSASPGLRVVDRWFGGPLRGALVDRILLERIHVVDVAEAALLAIASHRHDAWKEVEYRRDAECAVAARMMLHDLPGIELVQRGFKLFERSPREIIDALRPPESSLA